MRKEVWYAILAGSILGLIIAFGVARINSAFKGSFNHSPKSSPTPTAPKNNPSGITLVKPDNDDVLTKNPVDLSGMTSPASWIIISAENRDYIFKTNPDGSFDFQIDLAGGVNQFSLTSFDERGGSSSKNLRLVYSTEFPIPLPPPETATSGSEIKEKVEKKIQETLNSPRAYIGTVTDVSEGTLQIKTDSGEIKQISADRKLVSVIKVVKEPAKVNFSDIAIGDYIVAMGVTNGNHVLQGKRILIIPPLVIPPYQVLFGKIKNITKNEIILANIKTNEEIATRIPILPSTKYTTTKGDQTATIKLTGLAEGDLIIAAGFTASGKFTPRRVHLAEPTPTQTPLP